MNWAQIIFSLAAVSPLFHLCACKTKQVSNGRVVGAVDRPGVYSPCRVIPKDFKSNIYSFPAWCSAFMGGCGEQAGKLTCVLAQGT